MVRFLVAAAVIVAILLAIAVAMKPKGDKPKDPGKPPKP